VCRGLRHFTAPNLRFQQKLIFVLFLCGFSIHIFCGFSFFFRPPLNPAIAPPLHPPLQPSPLPLVLLAAWELFFVFPMEFLKCFSLPLSPGFPRPVRLQILLYRFLCRSFPFLDTPFARLAGFFRSVFPPLSIFRSCGFSHPSLEHFPKPFLF